MDGAVRATFQREVFDGTRADVLLLTYGQALLESLLTARPSGIEG